jgi:hypothetical protein
VTEEHITVTKQELQEAIQSAILEASKQNIYSAQLSEEEHRWVKLAIQAEADKIRFRKAVIEKTLAGLIWLAIIGVGSALWQLIYEWAINRGYKP